MDILKNHGLKGIYKGWSMTLMREQAAFMYFGNYEMWKRYFKVEEMERNLQYFKNQLIRENMFFYALGGPRGCYIGYPLIRLMS